MDNQTLTATAQNAVPAGRNAAIIEANRLATEQITAQQITFKAAAKKVEDDAHDAYHARPDVGEFINPEKYKIPGRD